MAESDERNPYLYERFTLKGGVLRHSTTGKFSSHQEGKNPVYVDLDDLGLDEEDYTPFASAQLRLAKRLSLNMGYFGYHESDKKRSEFEYEFGDIIIPFAAITDSEIDLDVYFANLTYSFYSSKNTEVGMGLGVHGADFHLKIYAETDPGNPSIPPTPIGEETEDFLAPLPNLYFFASRALSDKLLLHLTGGWMSLTYDEYDGNLFFVRGTLEYRLMEHFGIGGGYSYFDVDVERDRGKRIETYEVQFRGPLVFLVLGF